MPYVDQEPTADAGWLGGLFDGEGHITGSSGWHTMLSQNDGIVLERALKLLRERGFDVTLSSRNKCRAVRINGGLTETMRFLMLTRPERLIAKAIDKIAAGRLSLYGRSHRVAQVVGIESVGVQEVVALETDTHTYIAQGLASHNCNAWRAILHDPDAVASRCDWPVNENDLHARHAWLVGQRATLVPRLEGDPDYYDAKIAGWWLWGVAAWIGSGWCSGAGPWSVQDDGDGPRLVHLGNAGRGVSRRLVHLGDAGRGINGATPTRAWLRALSERLRRVRVCSGDWSRILTSSALAPAIDAGRRAVGGPSVLRGIFLDPPYSAEAAHSIDYGHDDEDTVAHDVRAWAIEHGTDRNLRIALCGYEGEGHDVLVEDHGWSVYAWSAKGCMSKNRGKGSGGNNDRERIWFSPGCLNLETPAWELLDSD